MKIPYSYIIVVPTANTTAREDNRLLMTGLARQTSFIKGKEIAFRAVTGQNENFVQETAQILKEEMTVIGMDVKSSDNIEFVVDATGEMLLRKIVDQALTNPPEADVLFLFMHHSYAGGIGKIVLWDILGCRSINPEIYQVYSPGEAGLIDCIKKSRNILHPEGYQSYAAGLYTGARR